MKASYVVIVALLLGISLGAGISWANFGKNPPLLVPGEPVAGLSQDQPKLSADARFHDFGVLEAGVKVQHVFRVRNIGNKPLTLEAGPTSCSKCTIGKVSQPRVEPGESADITVEFLPGENQTRFEQVATILTNDPLQSTFDLRISGLVRTRYHLVPDKFVLSRVVSDETTSAELKFLAYLVDKVQLAGYEMAEPELASYFDVRSEPLASDQWGSLATSGCRIVLTIKPGLPLGQIRQTIRLKMRLGDSTDDVLVEVPVEGNVVNDFSIAGAGWNAELGRLLIGPVESAQGAVRNLFLLIHGEHRHDVTIEPGPSDPDWLKVSLGEPSELNDLVTQYPLTITIPPGMPLVNRSGSDQGKAAEVVLQVGNHPQVKDVRLKVQFLIE